MKLNEYSKQYGFRNATALVKSFYTSLVQYCGYYFSARTISLIRMKLPVKDCKILLVWFPDSSCMNKARNGRGRKGLVNNSTPMWIHRILLMLHSCKASLVPRPHPKNWERGLVSLAKISVCAAVSAVFVWSRGITFVRYQLHPIIKFFTRESGRLIPGPFENGNEASKICSFHLLLSTAAGYHVIT